MSIIGRSDEFMLCFIVVPVWRYADHETSIVNFSRRCECRAEVAEKQGARIQRAK